MGFSLSSSEVAGSIAALTPTRSTLRAALCAGYTAVPTAQYCLGDRRKSFKRSPYRRAFRRKDNPASPSLGFLTDFIEDSFALKRFQQDGGVVGLGRSLRNRYLSSFFLLPNLGGGSMCSYIFPRSVIRTLPVELLLTGLFCACVGIIHPSFYEKDHPIHPRCGRSDRFL